MTRYVLASGSNLRRIESLASRNCLTNPIGVKSPYRMRSRMILVLIHP